MANADCRVREESPDEPPGLVLEVERGAGRQVVGVAPMLRLLRPFGAVMPRGARACG